AVALDDRALGGEVQRHDRDALAPDVAPHVEFGPVREREHAHALAGVHARVVEVPDLRPLPARVPALVAVAKGEHALLGTRAFLVATGAADGGVVAARGQRLAQRLGLHDLGVPAGAVALRADALAHAVLVHVHAQLDPGFGRAAVAERDHLAELPGGVHVQQRDRR